MTARRGWPLVAAAVALALLAGVPRLRLSAGPSRATAEPTGVPASAPAAAPDTVLTGRVTDLDSGRPLAGAVVRVGDATATTDADGRYRLELPAGRADVRGEHAGFDGVTWIDRTIGPGLTVQHLALPPLDAPLPRMQAVARRLRVDRVQADVAARGIGAPEGPVALQVTEVPTSTRVLMPDGTIVVMDLEEYLKGVVPAEMGFVFRRAAAALRAQAIASRTYAAGRCLPDSAGDPARCEPGVDANVDTTTRTQVWRPVHYDVTDAAVDATAGQVVRAAGVLVPTLFFARTRDRTLPSEDSACCGGRSWPHLRGASSPDPFAERRGHGAGMSQEGAAVLADWGATADEILRHYYASTTIDAARPVTPTVVAAAAGPAEVLAGEATLGAADLRATDAGARGLSEAEPGDLLTVTLESAAIQADFPFMALAARWTGAPEAAPVVRLSVRTSEDGRTWSDWLPMPTEDEVGDARLPSPPGEVWTGLVIARGRYAQLRADAPAGPDRPTALQEVTLHYLDADEGPAAPAVHGLAAGPTVISRAGWGADERKRFDSSGDEIWPPEYTVPRAQVVHHTVNENAPADPAAVVRSIYHYHAVTRGWGDIGYNFLVDHRGNVYEGRYGGERGDAVVQGGHALQFNPNTIGVALLGTFTDAGTRPTSAAESALVELLAAKGVRFGIDPTAPVTLLGQRFATGVLGHRDVLPGHTQCPGDGLASLLPGVRSRVKARMGQIGQPPTATRQPPTATRRPPTATSIPPSPTRVPPSSTPRPKPPTPTPPAGCVDLVRQGGFEAQTDDWMRHRSYYTSWDVYSGARAMFVGLRNNDPDEGQTYSYISQVLRLPAGVRRLQVAFAARTLGYPGDRMIFRLLDANGAIIALSNAALPSSSPWTYYVYDLATSLSGRAGTEARLYFAVVNDGDGDRSYMRLDDVALWSCPAGAQSASATASPSEGPTSPPTLAATATRTPTVPAPTAPPTRTAGPPTATPTPLCAEVLRDGSFEESTSGAWRRSGDHPAVIESGAGRSGGSALRLGLGASDPDAFDFAAASQAITVPTGVTSATLVLWTRVTAAGPGDALAFEVRRTSDGLRVPVVGPEEPVAGDWTRREVALPLERLGDSLELYLAVLNRDQSSGAGRRTSVLVDDASLVICSIPLPFQGVLPFLVAEPR